MTPPATATAGFASVTTAPSRKPLYLATSSPVRIAAQAESLLVQGAGMSNRRFPLARIDRIVCNSHADWSGEALALCMASGVTVTWISPLGDVLGQCVPQLGAALSAAARLESFVEHPDWAGRYQNWLRGRRMRVLIDWAAARCAEGLYPAVAEWEQRKREYVYRGRINAIFQAEVKGWCHAWVVSRLRKAGLPTRFWGYDASPLELADDLAGLIWAEINLHGGTLAGGAIGTRGGLLFFENWARLHPARIAEHLAELNRFVARENETWH